MDQHYVWNRPRSTYGINFGEAVNFGEWDAIDEPSDKGICEARGVTEAEFGLRIPSYGEVLLIVA